MIQWSGSNIIEICAFTGRDISRILISGNLFLPLKDGREQIIPIGAYIRKRLDGTFELA